LTDCAKHTNAVTTLAWMPDGKHFVSGGLDKKIYMWVRGPLLALHVLRFVHCTDVYTTQQL
jgi:WD40 repeat protein